MSDLDRRSFLRGLIAAPAVIRVAPLMRISALPLVLEEAIPSVEAFQALQMERFRYWSELVDAAFKRGVIPAPELRSFMGFRL